MPPSENPQTPKADSQPTPESVVANPTTVQPTVVVSSAEIESPAPQAPPNYAAQPAEQPTAQNQSYPQQNIQTNKTNELALAGFVLVFFVPVLGFILCLMSLSKIRSSGERGKGLAIGGIIIAIVETVIVTGLVILVFTAVSHNNVPRRIAEVPSRLVGSPRVDFLGNGLIDNAEAQRFAYDQGKPFQGFYYQNVGTDLSTQLPTLSSDSLDLFPHLTLLPSAHSCISPQSG